MQAARRARVRLRQCVRLQINLSHFIQWNMMLNEHVRENIDDACLTLPTQGVLIIALQSRSFAGVNSFGFSGTIANALLVVAHDTVQKQSGWRAFVYRKSSFEVAMSYCQE